MDNSSNKGLLSVVGTPIGNLEDITLRALCVLREADLIAAEDTRRCRGLLSRHGIRGKKLMSFFGPVERDKTAAVLREVASGNRVALVSSAGMPGISDPGGHLIRRALEEGLRLEVVPGPTAVETALLLSGLCTARYCFYGFLPRKASERRGVLLEALGRGETAVVFESARRVPSALRILASVDEGIRCSLVREITKMHEEVLRGTAGDLLQRVASRPIKGEVVLLFEGGRLVPSEGEEGRGLKEEVDDLQGKLGVDRMEAIKIAARLRGVGKREVYARLLEEEGRKGSS